MEKNILSRVGFMTQEDKNDFEKRLEILFDKTEKLEQSISRIDKKLDALLSNVANLPANEISAAVSEVKNNLRLFNQSERQLIKEIESKLFLQLGSQFDEIHYLQYNLQKLQQSAEFMEKNISQDGGLIPEFERLAEKLNKNLLTKDDLETVESFLRLIAANQLIQETYFENASADSHE